MYSRIYSMMFLLILMVCSFENDNPLDETGPNYVPPSIVIDAASVKDGDTVKGYTALLALSGNAPENQFRVRLKDGDWSPWFNAGSYRLDSLPEGFQIIEICGKYDGGDNYTYDSITVFVLKSKTDTTLIDTISVSDTLTIIDTISISDSLKVSYVIKVSDITMVMDSLSFPDIGANILDTMRTSDTIKIIDTVRIIDTIKISNGENSTDTIRISDTIRIVDTTRIIDNDTVKIDTVKIDTEKVDTIIIIDTVRIIDTVDTGNTSNPGDTSGELYTIKYDGNLSDGGKVPVDTNEYKQGSVITINEGLPLRRLYKFIGWEIEDVDSSKRYDEGDTLIMGQSDIILKAQWESIPSYQVELDGNGNTSGRFPPPLFMSEGEFFYIPPVVFVEKEGYVLYEWNTEKNGKGKSYDPGDKVRIEGNLILYAQWIKVETSSFSLKYICDDCDGELPESIKNSSDSVFILDSITYGKTGYSFKEWNTKQDGSGSGYKIGDTIIASGKDIELYALWNNPSGMVRIPSKNKIFEVGGAMFEIEWPLHNVKLTKDIWLDTIEVTLSSFSNTMKEVYPDLAPYIYSKKDENKPVNYVNWYGAVLYCNARTRLTNSTDTVFTYSERKNALFVDYELSDLTIDMNKKGFRLPTEAEWEYSARGDVIGQNFNDDQIAAIAWYVNNSEEKIWPVAQKNSNAFNLYDMLGNVSEWTMDWYYPYTIDDDTTNDDYEIYIDPLNLQSSLNTDAGRIHRGGNITYGSNKATCSFREYTLPSKSDEYIGFRCCLPID